MASTHAHYILTRLHLMHLLIFALGMHMAEMHTGREVEPMISDEAMMNAEKMDELLDLPAQVSLARFQEYVNDLLVRTSDKEAALAELDKTLGILSNHILSLSLLLKQKYLFEQWTGGTLPTNAMYTRQEVAIRYRVSQRTVTNWIADGLETIEMGGVRRISEQALQKYITNGKGKKPHWKSIGNGRAR